MNSHRFTTIAGGCALAFLGSIVLFAQGNAAAAAMKNPVAASAESVAAGQETYRKSCPSCHGIKAEGGSGNELYDQAVALVTRERKASTSFVQRHLQIGYNRAAKLIERMEAEGVVSGANHVGKREVLAPPPR